MRHNVSKSSNSAKVTGSSRMGTQPQGHVSVSLPEYTAHWGARRTPCRGPGLPWGLLSLPGFSRQPASPWLCREDGHIWAWAQVEAWLLERGQGGAGGAEGGDPLSIPS